MAKRPLSSEKLQEIRDLAAQWGKIVARRVSQEAGANNDFDFQTLEQIAQAAAQGLTQGTLSSLLEQEQQTLADQVPCPDCGLLCSLSHEDRNLTVQGGQLTLHEPVAHCPACRRDFFPPPGQAQARQP